MLSFTELEARFENHTTETSLPGISHVFKYLRDRGISEEDINKYGIMIMPGRDLIEAARGTPPRYSEPRLAVVFPHYNFGGTIIDWWSARFVDAGLKVVTGFAAMTEQQKLGKMYCPPNEPPHAYLPPGVPWAKMEEGDKVYIHESVLKAINCAKYGRYSIGLNGVWGWTSRKHQIALMDELKSLPWKAKKLIPVIVFDSNAEDNVDVQNAIARLAAKLFEITGQRARHILLPRAADGTHQGFDDFCVRNPEDVVEEYLNGEGKEIDLDEIELLKLELNSKVAVVRSLAKVVEIETGTIMTPGAFTDLNYATYQARDSEDKVQNVPRLWLRDTRRTEVERIDYLPGQVERIKDGVLNCWKGMGCDPLPGDHKPWLDLLERNVPDPALRKWIIQWFAYPIQNLGEKMTSFIHLWGPPGTGKNALLAPILKIYGDNSSTCDRDALASNFNSILANRQFVNFDEMHGGTQGDAMRITNKIKPLVTQPTIDIERKGVDKYTIRNSLNIVTTSNYVDSIRLDDDDRRCAVIRFGERGMQGDQKYWESYFNWTESEGPSALYDFLLNVDLDGFDPKGWAPMTEDKMEMIRSTRKADEQWVEELRDEPDNVLPPILKGRALFTNTELAQYAFADDPQGATPSKKNVLGIKMNSAGFRKIELKIAGKKERFWVIRQKDEEWDSERARRHLKATGYPGAK